MKKIQNKQAFTLVELIVVITILAILWTIAFISLQWYSAQARDSKRLSDISNIKKSVELFSLNTWKYPKPDDSFIISYSWETLRYQWIVWDQVSANLSRNLQEKPTDPTTWLEYTYSTIHSQTEYEVLGLYESDIISNIGANLVFAQQSNAETQDYPKIDWNYNWIYIKTASFYVPTPSIINGNIWANTDFLGNSIFLQSQVVTGWENIPWISTWWLDIMLSVYTWSITEDSTEEEKISVIETLQQAYNLTLFTYNFEIINLLSKTTDDDKIDLANLLLLNNWVVDSSWWWNYIIEDIFSYIWFINDDWIDYLSNIEDLQITFRDGSSLSVASYKNVELTPLELQTINNLWLTYYNLWTEVIQPNNTSNLSFPLNLDPNKLYYFKIELNNNIVAWRIGINYWDPTMWNYLFGSYSNYELMLENPFYINNWVDYDVYHDGDILQWILNIPKNLFLLWPSNISFEDFYNNNLLWNSL